MTERVPLLQESESRATTGLLDSIIKRRGGKLEKIDQMLIHSEAVARGWNTMFGALASECDIDIRIREIALLRIGILTRARYEFHQHRLIALKAGFTEAEIEAICAWETSSRFDDRERAVLAYTDAMTLNIQVPDAVFDALRPHFNERQLVELTATIAGYNMVARFMEALDLEP